MENPANYALSDDIQKRNVSYLIDEFADKLIKISGKCMDIGCGPGDITKNILLPSLDPNATIIGTDVSQKMIEYANTTYNDKKQIGFEVLDIETKNLPEKYILEFDHIFSFHVFHLCKDIQQVFKNIYRMLRPDGTMLISIVTSQEVFNVFKLMSQNMEFSPYMEDMKECFSSLCYSKNPCKEVKELLKNIGFKFSQCSHRDASFIDGTEKFLSGILSMNLFAFLDKMPHDLANKFKHNFTREYMKRTISCTTIRNNQEQNFTLNVSKTLIVYAQKVGILSIGLFAFLDKMLHDVANEFKHHFTREYMKRKISYTIIYNNQEQNFILHVYKTLIVYAPKVI